MSSTVDVLAMAAHPDDVEQTCAGTLIGMAEQGYRTGVLDLTAGEMGTRGSADERASEAASAAQEMLLAERHHLHLPDAKLENTLAARLAIAQKIRDLRPRVAILPYWQARYPDHYRCSQLGYEACFLAGFDGAVICGQRWAFSHRRGPRLSPDRAVPVAAPDARPVTSVPGSASCSRTPMPDSEPRAQASGHGPHSPPKAMNAAGFSTETTQDSACSTDCFQVSIDPLRVGANFALLLVAFSCSCFVDLERFGPLGLELVGQ